MFDLRRKAIFAAAFTFAAWTAPLSAAEFNAAQKTEIEGIVHSYLLEHPDVLRDVSLELEKRSRAEETDQRTKAIADNKQELFDSSFQAVAGNPKGKVTLVEFFDYNCGYCKRALTDLADLIKAEPELRVVLKDFPVLGPNSVEAANIASAVRKNVSPEKFWEFHQKLLLSRGQIGREQALNVARDMGLDVVKIDKDAKDPSIHAGLETVLKLGDTLNLSGTPSYIVGNEAVVGAVGYAELKSKVDALVK